MKTTSPFEFWRAVSFLVVIRGSNRARATIELMITKRVTKSRVMEVWKRCHAYQQSTSGKLVMRHTPLTDWHCTTISNVSVIGRNRTVTNSGTT